MSAHFYHLFWKPRQESSGRGHRRAWSMCIMGSPGRGHRGAVQRQEDQPDLELFP